MKMAVKEQSPTLNAWMLINLNKAMIVEIVGTYIRSSTSRGQTPASITA